MDSCAFATHSRADSPGFSKIPQDSPRFREDLRRFADFPKFSRNMRRFAKVRHGYTPIRGWIYADSRKFADGYTPICTRFTAISHVPRREPANGDSYISTLIHLIAVMPAAPTTLAVLLASVPALWEATPSNLRAGATHF